MRYYIHPTVGLYSVWFSEMLRDAALPLTRQYSVCDIGCGLGYHCFRLQREVSQVYGFDVSEETISWLRTYPHDIHFEYLDICEEQPAYEQQFDRIFSSDVYEHVDQPERMLANTYSMLKPGGVLVITFPNHHHHGHNQIETADELEVLFTQAGFCAPDIRVVTGPSKAYLRWLENFQRLRYWTDRFSMGTQREQTHDADLFHETTGFQKSRNLEHIPLLSPSLNLMMDIFVRSSRRHSIYDTEPEGADVREKRLLVVAAR